MNLSNIPADIFSEEYNEALIHQVITAYMAGSRQGSKAHKSRSDVAGGGKKPWRQKGSGRARAGTRTSPIWRSGGVTFAARPRDYSNKVNRKMYRKAMRSMLAKLVADERCFVIDEIKMESPKTRELKNKISKVDAKTILIITGKLDKNLYLSARNLRNIDIIDTSDVNPLSIVSFDKVLISSEALGELKERFQ